MKQLFLVLCSAILLSACAGVSTVGTSLGEAHRKLNLQRLQALDNWSLVGRIAYSQERESWQSVLNWQHAESVDKWRISSLLTGTLAELEYNAGELFMVTDKGDREHQSEAELINKLGFYPPFDYLKYWLRGMVSPFSESAYRLSDRGFIDTIDQQGWSVSLSRYEYAHQVWLPNKVSLQRGALKIKIIVDDWR